MNGYDFLLNAIKDVRPLVGDYYTFIIDGEKIRALCAKNYKHVTLFEDVRGWRFCLTPYEMRRYAE